MRPYAIALSCSLLFGCATIGANTTGEKAAAVKQTGKPSAADKEAVAQLRIEVETLLRDQGDRLWKAWTGGLPFDAAAFYGDHDRLFAVDRIAAVQRVRNGTKDPDERRALGFLEAYLVGEHLARATADASERLVQLEASATVDVDGESRPFRDLEAMLAAEADPAKRAKLQAAALPVLQRLDEVHREKRARLEAAAKALGFADATEAAAFLRNVTPDAAADLARSILDATAKSYREAFGGAANRELGLALGDLHRSDVPRLFAGPGFSVRFPTDGARPALAATLASLGLDRARIQIDEGEKPGKSPRPICFAVAAPGDVRLSIPATVRGGDWAALFHEAGSAQAFAHAGEGPFEFRQLGHEATAEAFSVLFENLTTDPEWLKSHTGMTGAEASAWSAGTATRRLYQMRRQAGRLLYQLESARAGTKAQSLYRKTMEEAYGFPLGKSDAAWYLADGDEYLFSADTLRAWTLAAMLEEHLIEKHGRNWWDAPAAGAELVKLWERGVRDAPEEIAKAIGEKRLSPKALARFLDRRLGS